MRCESCGGPAGDGNLCLTCQLAFQELLDNKWLNAFNSESSGPASDDQMADAESFDLASVSALFDETVAVSSAEPGDSPKSDSDAHWTLTAQVAHEMEESPSEAATGLTAAPTAGNESFGQLRLALEPVRAEEDDLPSRSGVVVMMPSAVPAEASERRASARPVPARSMLTAAAAVVVVAAIGFPLATMLRRGSPSPTPGEGETQTMPPTRREMPRRVAAQAPAPERQPASAAVVSALSGARPVAASVVSAPTRSRPSATVTRGAAATKPTVVRQPRPAAPQSASVAAPSPAIVAPAAEVAAPAPEVVAPAPPPEPAAAPSGPFFEMRDVTETPHVVSRVEPQVPDVLRGSVNEIVVVRVLVSQVGHPSLVRLLRGSRTGPVLDDAVVSAVSQWTFSPARRRGEAVSCWYHIGVPVRRTE